MPLWEVVVLDGLADGRWALATKTHHCLVDGVGSVDAAHLLLDGVGEALAAQPAAEEPHENALRRFAPDRLAPDLLVHGAGAALHAAGHPREFARRATAARGVAAPRRSTGSTGHEPERADLLAPARCARSIVDLDDVRAIKDALGGTVNDVVLAAVSAGLRDVLDGRGEQIPDQGLRAMVPMNVRRDDEHGDALGNRISSLFIDLPVAEPHAVARYEQICERTSSIKNSSLPLGAEALLGLTGLAPPVLHHVLAQSLFAKRLFNVTITNVPGPQRRLRALGSALEMVWPLVPIASDHTVGVAIISYEDRLFFGINADRDSMSDVDVLAGGIERGIAELRKVARATREVLTLLNVAAAASTDPDAPLTDVPMRELPLERFDAVLSPAGSERMHLYLDAARPLLAGRTIWNVNSTARGGGVAELLAALVPYARGAGVDARWVVANGHDGFFTLTKRLHNRLHGAVGRRRPARRGGAPDVRAFDRSRRARAGGQDQARRHRDPPRPADRRPDPRDQGDGHPRRLAGAHRRRCPGRAGPLGVGLPAPVRERRRRLRLLAAVIRLGRHPARALRVHQPVDRSVRAEERRARRRRRSRRSSPPRTCAKVRAAVAAAVHARRRHRRRGRPPRSCSTVSSRSAPSSRSSSRSRAGTGSRIPSG